MTLRSGLIVGVVALTCGCAASSPTSPDSGGNTTPRVLIIALARDPDNRDKFETALAAQLTRAGVAAFTSHAQLADMGAINRTSVDTLAAVNAVTLVAVIRVVDVDADAGTVAARQTRYFETFVKAAVTAMPQLNAHSHIALSTSVYHLPSQRLIWGGMSWTFVVDDVDRLINDTSALIAQNMIAAYQQIQYMRSAGVDVLTIQ